VFGASDYAPGTGAGRRLLAHELAHVVQQGAVGGRLPLLQRQESGGTAWPAPASSPQTGEEEAERRVAFAPRFPGCSPHDRRRLDYQLVRARAMVQYASGEVAAELDRMSSPGIGTISMAESALNTHFRTRRPEHVRRILRNLERIQNRLERGPENVRCVTEAGCRSVCSGSGDAYACAGPAHPIVVCPVHFTQGDTWGALTLIHEAAHQAGLMVNVIEWQRAAYAGLTTAQALSNADSYAMLVRDLRYGGTVARGRAWTSRDLGIIVDIFEPDIDVRMGLTGVFHGGHLVTVEPRFRRVENEFRGGFFFDVEGGHWPPVPRPRPFTMPEISVRVELVRTGSARARRSRPQREVLFDVTRRATEVVEAGRLDPMGIVPRLFFDVADQGTLHLTARMRDFDTATTITYRDFLLVRPTAQPRATPAPVPTAPPAPSQTPRPGPSVQRPEPERPKFGPLYQPRTDFYQETEESEEGAP
jgi:hypothetical protein